MEYVRIKSGIVPIYLTKGNWYEFKREDNTGCGFVEDDEGVYIYICVDKCAHLDWGEWESLDAEWSEN